MKPGIYKNIPFDEYLKIDAFSRSMVRPCLKSALALKHYADNEAAASRAMDFGSLVDCLTLEHEKFGEHFEVLPDYYTNSKGKQAPFTRQSKTCRAVEAEIRDSGKTPIETAKIEEARRVVQAIADHYTAAAWLEAAVDRQVTIIWVDADSGVLCKGRIDALAPDMIIDLKTTYDPYPGPFSRTINNSGYHIQGAFYHDGYIIADTGLFPEQFDMPFSIIAAQNELPYEVITYTLGIESMEAGRILYKEALRRYAEIKGLGEWPGYSSVAEEINIPAWALNRIQLEGQYD